MPSSAQWSLGRSAAPSPKSAEVNEFTAKTPKPRGRASVATPLTMEATDLGRVSNRVDGSPVDGPRTPNPGLASGGQPVTRARASGQQVTTGASGQQDGCLQCRRDLSSVAEVRTRQEDTVRMASRPPPRARLSSVAEVRTCQEDTMRVSSVPPPRTRLFSVETAADQETCGTALVSDTGGRQIPGMSMTMSEMSKVSRKSKVTKHSSPVDLAGCEVDGEGVTPGRQRGAAPSRGVRRLPAFPREVIEAPVSNSASRQNACAEESQRPRAALLDKAFSDHLPSGAES